jgi:hypothetical protein
MPPHPEKKSTKPTGPKSACCLVSEEVAMEHFKVLAFYGSIVVNCLFDGEGLKGNFHCFHLPFRHYFASWSSQDLDLATD